jgi:ribokinase
VTSAGENSIVLAPGANLGLTPSAIDKAEDDISSASVVICQMEIVYETVKYGIEVAKKHGKTVIFDPAPVKAEAYDLISLVDIITPNKIEAEFLTGIKINERQNAVQAIKVLREYGGKCIILKLGADGLYLYNNDEIRYVLSYKVKAVDTTAAGDAFAGVLDAAIVKGYEMVHAVEYANCAAAFAVTKFGAQASMPNEEEVEQRLIDCKSKLNLS